MKNKMDIKLFPYQTNLVTNVLTNLKTKPVVLAAAPGAGKTEMAIYIINTLLEENPKLKVLILAHGTTILRSQFATRIAKAMGSKKCQEVISYADAKANVPVTIAIPHAFLKVKKPKVQYDLMIVDEAHEFYFADKQGIQLRKLLKPKMQLLLTGTPFKFTRANNLAKNENAPLPYHIELTTMNQIIDERPDQVASLRVLVCQSSYAFTEDSYNQYGEVKESFNFKGADTIGTIKKVTKAILENSLNVTPKPISALEKTMIACRNIKQAYDVYNYLTEVGAKAAISVSKDEDEDDLVNHDVDQIAEFTKPDSDIQVLIVVNRAILGFNYPDLVNVVDLSGTRNIARMYQLMCRASRGFPNENQRDKEKLFIKVGPKNAGGHEYTLNLMTATLCLNEYDWFSQFDGKNFYQLPLPVLNRKKKCRTGSSSGSTKKGKPQKVRMYLDVPSSDLLFDGLKDNHIKNAAAKVGFTTLGKVREVLFDIKREIVNITEENLLWMIKHGKVDERIYG